MCRLFRQAGLRLSCSQTTKDRFSRVEAQMVRAKENLKLSHGGPSQRQASACADPWIFWSSSDCKITAMITGVFFVCFFSPLLILQFYRGVSNVYFRENYFFPKFQRGSNIFQGVQLFPGGGGGGVKVQMLISIETHITCDFPGGGGFQTPYSPVWIRAWSGTITNQWKLYIRVVNESEAWHVHHCASLTQTCF